MTARVAVATRTCECCNATFERRRFPSGQLERVSQFEKRRFCSRVCFRKAAVAGRRKQPLAVWIDGPYGPTGPHCASEAADPPRPVGVGYPWDRQRAVQGGPIPGPFPADRPVPIPEPRREDRS